MNNGVQTLGRLRLQGLLVLGLAFVSGGLAGIAVEHARTAAGERSAAKPVPPPPFGRRGVLPPQLERLDLTQEQRAEIRVIVNTHSSLGRISETRFEVPGTFFILRRFHMTCPI